MSVDVSHAEQRKTNKNNTIFYVFCCFSNTSNSPISCSSAHKDRHFESARQCHSLFTHFLLDFLSLPLLTCIRRKKNMKYGIHRVEEMAAYEKIESSMKYRDNPFNSLKLMNQKISFTRVKFRRFVQSTYEILTRTFTHSQLLVLMKISI